MYNTLNTLSLVEAAALLAKKTGKPYAENCELRIIRAGSQGQVLVYWRNSLQKFSALFGLKGQVKETSRTERLMRVSMIDLARLEIDERIQTNIFEPTEADWSVLSDSGSEDGVRAIIEQGLSVMTISRDQLLVFEADLLILAGAVPTKITLKKLTEVQEEDIRVSHAKGESMASLARKFKVSRPTIKKALNVSHKPTNSATNPFGQSHAPIKKR